VKTVKMSRGSYRRTESLSSLGACSRPGPYSASNSAYSLSQSTRGCSGGGLTGGRGICDLFEGEAGAAMVFTLNLIRPVEEMRMA
jgi:hypothetical protein